jgi:hypothetical protein
MLSKTCSNSFFTGFVFSLSWARFFSGYWDDGNEGKMKKMIKIRREIENVKKKSDRQTFLNLKTCVIFKFSLP